MNTGLDDVQVSLCRVIESSDHSVSNHPPSPRHRSGFCMPGLPDHPAVAAPFRAVRQLGFAIRRQARRDDRPNRVYWCYGLIVHLRLLSTPPRGDAVTFGYGMPDHPDKDFHLADSMQLQAHLLRPFRPPVGVPFVVREVFSSAFPAKGRSFAERKTTIQTSYSGPAP